MHICIRARVCVCGGSDAHMRFFFCHSRGEIKMFARCPIDSTISRGSGDGGGSGEKIAARAFFAADRSLVSLEKGANFYGSVCN